MKLAYCVFLCLVAVAVVRTSNSDAQVPYVLDTHAICEALECEALESGAGRTVVELDGHMTPLLLDELVLFYTLAHPTFYFIPYSTFAGCGCPHEFPDVARSDSQLCYAIYCPSRWYAYIVVRPRFAGAETTPLCHRSLVVHWDGAEMRARWRPDTDGSWTKYSNVPADTPPRVASEDDE